MASNDSAADAGTVRDPGGGSPAEKVKQFPAAPGVYLMKDAQGRVLDVGKAKNLRNRASHYFTQAAAEDRGDRRRATPHDPDGHAPRR